jgi:hypothetical protein
LRSFQIDESVDTFEYRGKAASGFIDHELSCSFLGLKEDALSLPVDFEAVEIILVVPVAFVRLYSQLTAPHAPRSAFFSENGNSWE